MSQITDSSTTPEPTPNPRRRRRGLRTLLIAVATAVVVVASGGLWWFFSGNDPERVNIDSAASGVTTTVSDSPDGGAPDETATATDGITGTWKVDTTSGDFDFESATGTFAGFRIEEELSGVGSTEAVGRTGDVSGSFTIEGTTVTAASFEVDLTTITTDEPMRDRRVQDALETSTHPTATFVLSQPIQLGDDAADGSTVEVDADGELTIHGVTQSVTVPLQARLVDGTVVVVGSVDISFADYDVEVPSSMRVLSVDDHGTVEFQLLLRR